MPIVYKSNCKICQRCKANPEYMKELYRTKWYSPGGESLLAFAKRNNSNYLAIGRHTKKHQFISDRDMTDKGLQAAAVVSMAEILQAVTDSGKARQAVLDMLYSKLVAKGNLKIGKSKDDDISVKDAMSLLLTATKNTDDVKHKEKESEADLLKQLSGLRSGAHTVDAANEDMYKEVKPSYMDPEEGELSEAAQLT